MDDSQNRPLQERRSRFETATPVLTGLLLLALASCATDNRPLTGEAAERELDRAGEAMRQAEALYTHAVQAPDQDQARERYNLAVTEFVDAWQSLSAPGDWKDETRISYGGRDYRVKINAAVADGFPARIQMAEELRLAADVELVEGIERVTQPGLGVPMVALREHDEEVAERFPFAPPSGLSIPCTAVLEFRDPVDTDGPREVVFHLVNTREIRALQLRGSRKPVDLAWDLSADLQLGFETPSLTKYALSGLLNPGETLKDSGLYRLNHYRPDQIPIVFIHGLNSDPHIWHAMVNAIVADPDLRDRYQPWCFLYPTGLSVPQSARILRESLEEARNRFDPQREDPLLKETVIVSHSMGGLLTRLQVGDPQLHLWHAFFEPDPGTLKGDFDPELAARIRATMLFEPDDEIARVVFISTPHRGSRIADWSIVKLAVRLIKLPIDFAQTLLEFDYDQQVILNPELRKYSGLGARSVENLSPEHPFFGALEKMPVLVPHHSIIGDRGRGDTPDSSDGAVPYWSSHLSSADSEKIVPYDHGNVEKPDTITEVKRLLHLHLKTLD